MRPLLNPRRPLRDLLSDHAWDGVFLFGVVLAALGLWLLHPALALTAGGAFVAAVAYLHESRRESRWR